MFLCVLLPNDKKDTTHIIIMAAFNVLTSDKIVSSQQFSHTFYKVTSIWDKKVGKCNYKNNCFYNNTNNITFQLAMIMNTRFMNVQEYTTNFIGNIEKKCKENNFKNVVFMDESLWFYNQRKGDILPKTQNDHEKMYNFVDFIVSQYFDTQEQFKLRKHMTITCCFFLWYLSKPQYFYTHNRSTYTCRTGKVKPWTCYLIQQKPKIVQKKDKKEHNLYKNESHSVTTSIPKKEKEINDIIDKLEEGLHISFKDKSYDQFTIHGMISKALTNSDISTNKLKKYTKLYQTYQLEIKKLNELKNSIQYNIESGNTVELEDGSRITFKQVLPKKDKKQLDTHSQLAAAEEEEEDTPTIDKLQGDDDDEFVPDCWEDLA